MGDNPSHFKGAERPVEQVSWNGVQGFLKRLNAVVPDGGFRLPTEAEWEYACRAGTETAFSFGDQITPEQVNYRGDYPYTRRLSEKTSVEHPIVAVGKMKGDNNVSLLLSLLSNRHWETDDECAPKETVPALASRALPA
jgi:formylglycine-generating enzyme required for sulfatase activity